MEEVRKEREEKKKKKRFFLFWLLVGWLEKNYFYLISLY
jgi:hypothetical protein